MKIVNIQFLRDFKKFGIFRKSKLSIFRVIFHSILKECDFKAFESKLF
jgi:hypothetical protein